MGWCRVRIRSASVIAAPLHLTISDISPSLSRPRSSFGCIVVALPKMKRKACFSGARGSRGHFLAARRSRSQRGHSVGSCSHFQVGPAPKPPPPSTPSTPTPSARISLSGKLLLSCLGIHLCPSLPSSSFLNRTGVNPLPDLLTKIDKDGVRPRCSAATPPESLKPVFTRGGKSWMSPSLRQRVASGSGAQHLGTSDMAARRLRWEVVGRGSLGSFRDWVWKHLNHNKWDSS